MRNPAVTADSLQGSVIAVPPLALDPKGAFRPQANAAILAHLRHGGVTTYLYGGNANLYHLGVEGLVRMLAHLATVLPEDGWLIPSIGPSFGVALEQAERLREGPWSTAMVLPMAFPFTPEGVERGMHDLAERLGRPLIAYVKQENYLAPEALARLLRDGVVCAVKYAVVRPDPASDPYLEHILDAVGSTERIVSGMGERPLPAHGEHFGLRAFTSGSVCIAPALSSAILDALRRGDFDTVRKIRELFLPLEELRDRHSPLRVLHSAVRLAGIADTGALLPFLSNLEDPRLLAEIEAAAGGLRAREDRHRREKSGFGTMR